MRPTYSFEFMPAKDAELGTHKEEKRSPWKVSKALLSYDPAFYTVTYAGDQSTHNNTSPTAIRIQDDTGIKTAVHQTCYNRTQDEIRAYTDELITRGIKRFVALRGDIPKGKTWTDVNRDQYFQYSSDLVQGLRNWYGDQIDISIACYPTKHPEAPSLAVDIEALKKKFAAGADRALSQFFFDAHEFIQFEEQCREAGITEPIVPGLMAFKSYQHLKNMSRFTDYPIPEWLHKTFEAANGNKTTEKEIAAEMLATQVQCLHKAGIEHIHFYTGNSADTIDMAFKDAPLPA